MPVDRKSLKKLMTKASAPPLHCPECYHGTIEPISKTYCREETAWSEGAKGHDGWEPEWFEGRFAMLMQCNRKDCGEIISVVGDVDRRQGWNSQTEDDYWYDALRPKYFCPFVPLFQIPEGCPEDVKQHIEKAFELFWCDPAASVNRIRQAVEVLLTHMKVPRFTAKRKSLTLHARIERILRQKPEVAKPLLATKWLGNEGSHGDGQIETDDVCDALDLLEYVLEEVIGGRTKAVTRLSEKINKAKGPHRKS